MNKKILQNSFIQLVPAKQDDQHVIDNSLYPANEIYSSIKNGIQNIFYEFIKKDILQIGSVMQQYKPSFYSILSNKDGLCKNEEIVRDIIILQLKRYFPNVEAEAYHNGKVDIKIKNFDNRSEVVLIECLRWKTYSVKKIDGKKTYKSKIEQIFNYRDHHNIVILITFVEDFLVKNCVIQAKEHAESCNIIEKAVDNNMTVTDNNINSFTTKHSTERGEVELFHVFFDFKIDKKKSISHKKIRFAK